MSAKKTHIVKSKVAFTGKRALTNIPGEKKSKGYDVKFFEGESEALPETHAKALAKAYGYTAVKVGDSFGLDPFDSIPGKDDLIAAGLDSMEKVVEYAEEHNNDFSALDGIGQATSKKIVSILTEDAE